MSLLRTFSPKSLCLLTSTNPSPKSHHFSFSFSFFALNPNPNCHPSSSFTSPSCYRRPLFVSATSSSNQNQNQNPNSKPTPKLRRRRPKTETPEQTVQNSDENLPTTIPRKARHGRRSEAVAVEDFVRSSLEKTFASIRQQNAEVLDKKEEVLNEKIIEEEGYDDGNEKKGKRKEVIDEDDPDWPADADIGWGIRASEYFEKHPIKNVMEDGVEIDWEGEMDDSWVKEINCLEWESFAFHPSPLIVLVFERYNRAGENWKLLKELEKAIKVYWNAKNRLPPRAIKIDVNIERDLAYALKANECPQLLFLQGNRILYREKGVRTADELVQMIAHFYYNAKKPSCIDDAFLASPY